MEIVENFKATILCVQGKTLKSSNPTSGVLLFTDVLHESRVHPIDCIEERLNRRVVGNGSSTLRVRFHAVHEYLQRTLERIEELLLVVYLPILKLLK